MNSHGFASTPNRHRMVQVRMLDPTMQNYIVNDVLTNVLKTSSQGIRFKERLLNEEKALTSDRVKLLAYLDCSRKLLSARYEDDVLPSLFWIPIPDKESLDKTRVINGPKPTLLWKDIDGLYSLTATVPEVSNKAGKPPRLSTDSQALKFEFLQFASHLLEARFYFSSENQVEVLPKLFVCVHFFGKSYLFHSTQLTYSPCGSIRVAKLEHQML